MTENMNIKNWVEISSVMIGVSLTVLTLIFGFIEINSLLMRACVWALLGAVVLFTNALTTNAKALYELSQGAEKINHWIKFAEFSFGFAFTLVLSAFAIISYRIVDIIAPTVLLGSAWLIMISYTYLDAQPGQRFKGLRSMKRNLWFLIELGVLILIYIDKLNIL